VATVARRLGVDWRTMWGSHQAGASGPELKSLEVGLGEDLFGGLGPDQGLAAVVPAVDEGADLDHQVADRGKGAAVDGLTLDDLDDAEPHLKEVQSRSGGRGEVDSEARVGPQPVTDFDAFVGYSVQPGHRGERAVHSHHHVDEVVHGRPPTCRAQNFPLAISFNAASSGSASASSRSRVTRHGHFAADGSPDDTRAW
jgi:hypothetical protein